MNRLDARGTLAPRMGSDDLRLGKDGQDFVFAEDQDVLPVDPDVRARVLSEQDLVADLHGLLLLDATDDETIVQRSYLHRIAFPFQSADGLAIGSLSTSWMTWARDAAGARMPRSRTVVLITSRVTRAAMDSMPVHDVPGFTKTDQPRSSMLIDAATVIRRSDTSSFMEASPPSSWKTMCFSEEA